MRPEPGMGVARRTDWRALHADLSARDRSTLSADALDDLADALFWIDQPEESLAARRDAYRAFVASGSDGRAAQAAWRLFYDHFLVGERAVAGGWMERARQHAANCDDPVVHGWLAVADADCALADDRAESALTHAEAALAAGRGSADPDLTAMALQAMGRALVACGRPHEGVLILDEAMISVVADELDPLFAGWVYCNVISTCYGLADVKRAAEWCQAALRWCDDLDDGRIYPGLCRVYAAELALLQGDWAVAATSAEQACRNLDAHDPRYAGEAYYLVGEACRRRGDIDGAEEAFIRAHGLGRLPQPGLALVRLEQGRADHAVKALRASLDAGPASPLPRAQLLGALVEACAAVRDDDGARAAADELTELAGQSGAAVIAALARLAAGHVALVAGRPDDATTILRQAWQELAEVGLLHEAARARFLLGSAASALNDDETGAMEVLAALAVFEQLGAEPDVRRAREFLEPSPVRSALLSSRELEVLRLVASGATNREIAETLVVSRHTVTRHVSNIFTKIGVASRAAATAYAYEHGMV